MSQRIRIEMIADASVGGRDYGTGREYTISLNEYAAIKQSCKIINNKKHNALRKGLDRILVVIAHGIGNIINKTPMLIKLRELYPEAQVDILVDEMHNGLLKGFDAIDDILTPEFDLHNMTFDLIINTLPAGMTIKGIQGEVITGEQAWIKTGHEVDANMNIIEMLGWGDGVIPDPAVPVKSVKFPAGKYIGISAGFGGADYWEIKNWGYEKYARLIEKLLVQFSEHKIIIFGTGKDRTIWDYLPCKVSDIKKHKDKLTFNINGLPIINAVDKYSIQETAYLISLCDFIVCNDTGLGHIASAVGTRSYSIFGATSIVKNHPYKFNTVISLDLECQPCQFTTRWLKCKDRKCMEIEPEQVLDVIVEGEIKKSYELGILIATFDRYEMLYTTLASLSRCKDFKSIKICFIDDGSLDTDIDGLFDEFNLAHPGIDVKVIQHKYNYGKENYSKTIKEGYDALDGCKYILFMPDDITVNPYLFQAIRKSYKYLKGDIKGINFMIDSRATREVARRYNYESKGVYDKYFHYVDWTDGFLCLFSYTTFGNITFRNTATTEGSAFWTEINSQFLENKYRQLRLNESLCLHVGNLCSKMNEEERASMPIRSVKVNLFGKPKILK